MTPFFLLAASLIAATLTFATNWLALIPWRRAKGQHWAERARLYHPVRTAAASNFWLVPVALSLSALLFPEASPHWALLLLVTSLGAIAGTIPVDREVFPRITLPNLLRQIAFGWSMRVLPWIVFAGAIITMPNEFNLRAAMIGTAVIALYVVWSHVGFIRVGQMFGFFVHPPELLQNIVRDTAAKVNVRVKRVWVMRISLAQAFALPPVRTLIFTDRLLELCPAEEVAAICAHELAHLDEDFGQYSPRYVSWLMFLPWIFIMPTLNTFGSVGLLIFLPTLLVPMLYRRISRKLEVRADQGAHEHQAGDQVYARALARLYEDSLIPAVLPKSHATHPHLYDRLVAAGMTPDFPRPKPARSMAWHGQLFAGAFGLVLALVLMRFKLFS